MRNIIAVLCVLTLTSCGGGGGDSDSVSNGTPAPAGWQAGVFASADSFAARCAAPRSGVDPFTHTAYPDHPGSVLYENNWLRSWSNDTYLWFDEIVDQNPALFSSTASYFNTLRTPAYTASLVPKDRFHFTYPTAAWEALASASTQVGYGAAWVIISDSPPRKLVVAFTEPGSPATAAGIVRGDEVLFVDGVDLVNTNDNASIDILNAGLFPADAQETHTFQIHTPGAPSARAVTMVSANITSQPVQNVGTISTTTGSVGYIWLNDDLATAEAALVSAFTQLQNAPVTDLVLDIRYNGGGYVDIASEVAYMIAGPGPTAGMIFEVLQFNSKHPTTDPVTGNAIVPVMFESTTQGFSTTAGQPLPTLNLPRVFVLTGRDTCSASESIINGLRGVGVQVIQIGSRTCGKPYGFYAQDNCGTTYFSIQFRGVNAAAFGDYPDGFAPLNGVNASAYLPGCSVADDFTHALGDPAEDRLAAALAYRANPSICPAASGLAKSLRVEQEPITDGWLPPSPLRQLRLLRQ